jgi:predicted HicB family RNase H-like nuclease
MPRTKLPQGSVSVTFRLPRQAQKRLAERARREGLSISEFVRRVLRREIAAAGLRTSRHGR